MMKILISKVTAGNFLNVLICLQYFILCVKLRKVNIFFVLFFLKHFCHFIAVTRGVGVVEHSNVLKWDYITVCFHPFIIILYFLQEAVFIFSQYNTVKLASHPLSSHSSQARPPGRWPSRRAGGVSFCTSPPSSRLLSRPSCAIPTSRAAPPGARSTPWHWWVCKTDHMVFACEQTPDSSHLFTCRSRQPRVSPCPCTSTKPRSACRLVPKLHWC